MRSRGVLYMTLAALAFSVMSVLVKLASPRIPTGEIVLVRSALTLAISYVMVRRAGISPWGVQRGRLVVRGALGFAALSTYFIALALLPLAPATTLHHLQPLITAVLAWWLLGERLGWAAAFAIAGGLAGVGFIVHPDLRLGPDIAIAGVGVAVASAVFSSLAYVTVRQLATTEHALVIVFYFPLVALPLSIPWAAADFVWPSAYDWLLLAGIGAATQLGQVFLTLGLTLERAGRATAAGYIQIVFAMMWQLVVFGDAPALGTLVGAALIISGTVAVSATAAPGAAPPSTRASPRP